MSAVEPDSAVERSEMFESVLDHRDYVPDQKAKSFISLLI